MSTLAAAVGRMPQSAAALRWLSTAPSPQVMTAANQRPWPLRTVADGVHAAVEPVQPPAFHSPLDPAPIEPELA